MQHLRVGTGAEGDKAAWEQDREVVLPETQEMVPGPSGRDALEGTRPQRWLQRRLDSRLEEVAEAVGGRLLSVTNAIEAGHLASGRQWLGIGWAPWRGGGNPPTFQCIPALPLRLSAPLSVTCTT